MHKGGVLILFGRARYRARARYRFRDVSKRIRCCLRHILQQRPALDQQRSELDNEHDDENENDFGEQSQERQSWFAPEDSEF
jgi:hypothetical protein